MAFQPIYAIKDRHGRGTLLPYKQGVDDGSTLTLDFTTGQLDPRLTFTRASGGTYTGNDGLVYGMDFATSSSLAIGTGSKSVTLTATAGVDRRYIVGQTVYISNGANNMSGPVTAYDASTQVLTISPTATNGSGSFTSWTVGNASARFDHDPITGSPRGLLIEGAATNRIQQSAAVRTSPWVETALVTAGTSINAPDGTPNGVELVWTNGTTVGNAYTYQEAAVSASTTYTMSVYLKPKSVNINTGLYIQARAGTTPLGYMTVSFFHASGNMGTVAAGPFTSPSATSTDVGNGWYRVTVTGTSPATTTNIRFFIVNANTGNGTDGVYAWGAQVEAGSSASSYIPTGGSQGTRARDECSITVGNFSSWFTNPNEGSFFVQYSMNYPSASMGAGIDRYAFEISDSAGLSRALCIAAYRNAPPGRNVRVFNPSVTSFDSGDTQTTSSDLNTKFAFGYATADNYIAAVGVAQAFQTYNTGSLPTSPAINQMWLGTNRNLSSTTYLFGCIRTIKYWPTRLSNAKLQSLTT